METYTLADLDPTAVVSPTQVARTQQGQHQQLVDELVDKVTEAIREGDSKGAEARVQKVLDSYEERFAELMADAETQSWLLGGGAVADQVGKPGKSTPLGWVWSTVQWAADAIFGRKIVQPGEFYQLDAKARRKHFTVAGRHTDAVLERVRDAIGQVVSDRSSLELGRAAIREAIRGSGSPMSRHHVDTVYRTTTMAAFNDAQWTLLQRTKSHYPFIMDVSIPDNRRSKLCDYCATAGIDGTAIYRTDDKVYAKMRPLRHFNCRCSIIPLTRKDAERYGITGDPKHEMTPPPDTIAKQGRGFLE